MFLHITAKRDDGYHNLQSVFCPIGFGDELTFLLSDGDTLVNLTGASHLTDRLDDNLIIKAVQLLAKTYPNHVRPLSIHLNKQIPTGAGLGGGSSNCATTLLAINDLWQLNLSPKRLIHLGATLGADVPFFIFSSIYRSCAIVEGIGEHLSKIELPKADFLLLFPQTHISTACFFAKPTLKKDCKPISHTQLKQTDFYNPPHQFTNVFEAIATKESPNIAHALAYLKQIETLTQTKARLTGTGSTVFLPLVGLAKATQADLINNAPCPALIAPLYTP